MEEVIEQLRECNEPVLVPLTLPDEDELIEVEEQLLLSLPEEYKNFLLTVSDVVYGFIEPATITDPNSHTYLPEMAATAWDHGVSRALIPICQMGDDYYCIDQDGKIFLWSGDDVTEDEWDNIWDWAKDVWLES